MIWNLDWGWLLMTITVVAALSFFFGAALDAIMRDDGFGPTGNTIIFVIGFFGAVYVANLGGINLRDIRMAVACGLGGAFATVATLAILKAGLQRL